MLRPTYEFTYTSALSYVEDSAINRLIALSKKEDQSEEEKQAVAELIDFIPEVTQVRITVAQCNGLMSAKYNRMTVDARDFFVEQSGLTLPYEGALTAEQVDIRNAAFDAAAALAATVKFEQRTTKPLITADGIAWYPNHPIVPRKAVAELPVLQGVERLQECQQLGIGDLDRSHAAAQAAHCWQGRFPTPLPSTRFFAGIC